MPKHQDIMRHPEYWAFVARVAHDQKGSGDHDETTHGAFADWLDERGDPRSLIARRARRIAPGMLPAINSYSVMLDDATTVHRPPYPASAYNINAHTGVELGHHEREWTADELGGVDLDRWGNRHIESPALYWRVHVPRTRALHPKSDTAHFAAPVSTHELWQFIDRLPANKKPQWERVARSNGWHRPAEPERLARNGREEGQTGAADDAGSANHAKRLDLLKQVLSEAKLNPATVRTALAHDGAGARAAAVAVIRGAASPERVRFAAAWYGLLAQEPRLTVFHPAENGEDALHVLTSPHPSQHVADYLRRAGVKGYAIEANGTGSRAYVYDAGGGADLKNITGGLNASYSRIPGTGSRLGSRSGADADADARADYRTAIRDYEAASGVGGGGK